MSRDLLMHVKRPTVPFVFKGKKREGVQVKPGCWYKNVDGVAIKTGTLQKPKSAVATK